MKHSTVDPFPSAPCVMAILNVTPDSFYAGSRTPSAGEVERRVLEAVGEGASIIDVGGYSSRPGADEVPPDEEWRRVALGVEAVRRLAPDTAVSVDTFRSGIAARAIVNAPAVLLADEPSGNLDTRNREEIHRLFFDLRDELGQTVVIVTHDERLAAMADRKITMSDGRII